MLHKIPTNYEARDKIGTGSGNASFALVGYEWGVKCPRR